MPVLRAPGQIFENAGADTSVSEGTNITAGSANTKGSYTQLIASTARGGGGILLSIGGSNTSDVAFLVDIAVGAAASEQVIIPNLFYFSTPNAHINRFFLPIAVPAGSRISARCQSTTGSATMRVNAIVIAGESEYPGSGLDYGTNTGSTTGTTATSSGSSNTKGSWAQIVSATTRSHMWGIVCGRGSSGSQYLFDIGIGGSGSEQLLIPNLTIRASSGGRGVMYSLPMRIPSGTRIAARVAAASGTQTVSLSLVMF